VSQRLLVFSIISAMIAISAIAKPPAQGKAKVQVTGATAFPDPEGVRRPPGPGLVTVVVPAGKVGRTECYYNAGYENAVIVYSNEPTPVELMRCGNTSNNVRNYPLTMPPGTYHVAAWHKDAYVGDSDITQKRWTNSSAKVVALSPAGRQVLVEDGTDNDFDDVTLKIFFSSATSSSKTKRP